MLDYFFTCLAICGCVWLACHFLQNAPARVSFYLIILALLSWLVPWQLLPDSVSAAVPFDVRFDTLPLSLQSPMVSTFAAPAAQPAALGWLPWLSQFTWGHLLLTLLGLGVGLFIYRLWQYCRVLTALWQSALPAASTQLTQQQIALGQPDYPIVVTKLPTTAIATGLLKPTIWVDVELLQRPELNSVLVHEATHIRQGDIVWLWLICLIESLFWWNPLCRSLATKARQLLELSCDESCFRQLKQHYQSDLASLLLQPLAGSAPRAYPGAPVLNLVSNKDFNVLRVKMLNKEKVMKVKHLVMIMAAVSISTVAAVQINEAKPVTAVSQPAATASFSAAFQAQQADLLRVAAKAGGTDTTELTQAVSNIKEWHRNRQVLPAVHEEQLMQLNAFSLLAHVQHKLGHFQDVISTFEAWYPEGSAVPFFLRNITANTYLKMNNPDLAIKELTSLQQTLGDQIQPGSLYFLALAYVEKADYNSALQVLAHPKASAGMQANLLRYYIYSQQNDVVQRDLVKATLPAALAAQPASKPGFELVSSPLLPLLPAS